MRRFLPLLVLLAAVGVAGCGGGRPGAGATPATPATSGRTIVLVTIEQFRPDRLALYGGPVSMKSLEGLAARGVVYTDAVTTAPMARPAAASILTGQGADRLGVRDDYADRLPAGTKSLAELLRGEGFRTAAFVASPLVSWTSGLDRGFELFDGPVDVPVGPGRYFPSCRPAAEVLKNFKAWRDTLKPGESSFAWIHLADLRGAGMTGVLPETPKDDVEAHAAIDAALGEVAGEGAAGAGVEVVVVGTGGALRGEDGARGDAFWLRPETLRVPLIWAGPAARGAAGTKDGRMAWLPDVAATALAVAGVATPAALDGLDLFGNPASFAARSRLAWTWAPNDQLGWPARTVVVNAGGRVEEIADASPLASRRAVPRPRALPAPLAKALDTHGVIERPADGKAVAAPADADAFLTRLQQIRFDAARNRLKPAWRASGELVAAHPEQPSAWVPRLFLAALAQDKGVREEVLKTGLARFGRNAEVLHWAAHVHFSQGRPAEAEPLLEAAAALGPLDADLLYDLACARSLAGDKDGGFSYLERAIEAGFRHWEWMERDSDLGNLRADPRYAALQRAHAR